MEQYKSPFLKKQSVLGDTIKSFRQSSLTRMSWIRNRYAREKAITKWHNSFEGRMFHRKLNRYNLTHEAGQRSRLFY